MSTFVPTVIVACVVVMLAIGALAIGWLLTGKVRIRRGSCGMDPTKRRQDDCGTQRHCDLCDHFDDKKKE